MQPDQPSVDLQYSGPKVIKLFSCSTQLSMKFHLVIKIKIPTIKTSFKKCQDLKIYEQNKFHAQLS